jgi:hypothetical protein
MDTTDRRCADLVSFYTILDRLEGNLVGERLLADCSGRMLWPKRGVYFFREAGENRSDTGNGPRIVRVGTHALKAGAATKIWTRLSQHKSRGATGGGNHRGSVFRLIVGAAVIGRDKRDLPTWGDKKKSRKDVKGIEHVLECEVSGIIGRMPFLWLAVDDEAGPKSLRGRIEKHSIGLLSNYAKPPLDPPSPEWLGRHCDRELVSASGLWNSDYVDEGYDPEFLPELERLVWATDPTR